MQNNIFLIITSWTGPTFGCNSESWLYFLIFSLYGEYDHQCLTSERPALSLSLTQIAFSFYLMEREKKRENVSMPLSDGQNKLHLQDPNYIV